MFILYKKKTYWPFLPMLNSPLMNKKSSSFYFEPFPFLLGFLVFIFLSLWFFLSFYFFISFFRLSLLLLLTLSSHFFLSLQYKTPLFSLPHVFIFLFRALHPLTPPSSYTHWMWLGPFVLCLPPWQNIMIIIMAMMLMLSDAFQNRSWKTIWNKQIIITIMCCCFFVENL